MMKSSRPKSTRPQARILTEQALATIAGGSTIILWDKDGVPYRIIDIADGSDAVHHIDD